MLAGSVLGVRQLSSATVGYAFPLLFAGTCALLASACGIRAATAFARGEVLAGIWMVGWTGILIMLCLAGVRWLIYGLGSDSQP